MKLICLILNRDNISDLDDSSRNYLLAVKPITEGLQI